MISANMFKYKLSERRLQFILRILLGKYQKTRKREKTQKNLKKLRRESQE